jgi:hypothetical protein
MPRFQFSLLGLSSFVVFAALVCGALVSPGPFLSNLVFTIVLLCLSAGALGAFFRTGPARAFWRGFTALGFGYLVLVQAPWFDRHVGNLLVTEQLIQRSAGLIASFKAARLTKSDRAILAQLESPVSVDFVETPLGDVLDFLRDLSKVNMVIDRVALEEEGVTPATPVTIHVEQVPMGSVLRLLLGQLNLTFVPNNDVLMITSAIQASGVRSPHTLLVGHSVAAIFVALVGGSAARWFTRPPAGRAGSDLT